MVSLTLFCYMKSGRKEWYKYHWKGFFLISIACILIVLDLTLQFPTPFAVIRKIISLSLGISGFWLVMVGGEKGRQRRHRRN